MSKWREVRLGEIVNLSQGLAINKQSRHLQTDDSSELPLLRISDMKNGTVEKYIKKEVSEKFIATKSDIIYTRTGQVGLVFTGQSGVIHNNCFKIIPDNKLVNKSFLYWILKSKYMYNYVNTLASGAAQPDLTHSKFKNIKIKIPDLETQEKIAQVLSSYDELIENNNRRIELLENMAEEIYKEWFVRMRFPGHEEVRFEKGIPEGWEVKKFINNNVKLISSGIDEFDGNKVYLATADVDGINIVGGEKINYRDKPSRANMQPIKGSIWFAKMQNTIKHLYFDKFSNDEIKNIILSTGFAGIKFKNINYFYYYLSFIRYGVFESIKDMYANGSTQVAINNQNIKRLQLIIPKESILLEFNNKMEDVYLIIKQYKEQNQNLIKQRDMLLPRLMNGTIEVE